MMLFRNTPLNFIIVFLFAFGPVKAQQITDTIFLKNKIIRVNAQQDTVEISGFKNGKLHGKQKLFHPGKRLYSTAQFKKGHLHGKKTSYNNQTQQIYSIEHYKYFPKLNQSLLHGKSQQGYNKGYFMSNYRYKKGKQHGKYKLYHTNGGVSEKGRFKEGLYVGRKKKYQPDGRLLSDENFRIIDNPNYVEQVIPIDSINKTPVYLDDIRYLKEFKEDKVIIRSNNVNKKISVLDGKAKYYGNNGNLQAEFNYKNGKKEGLCIEYNPNGGVLQLQSKREYKEGRIHGKLVEYSYNGNKRREGVFYEEITTADTTYRNVYDGEVVFYQDNGNKQRVENWKDYQKNGVQETYQYSKGTLSSRFYLVNNLKSGPEIFYDTEGRKTSETHYEIVVKNGEKVAQKVGKQKSWKEGKLITEGTWEDGVLEGKYIIYYENQEPLKIKEQKTYKHGNLEGPYQTFYPSGQLEKDYRYHKNKLSKTHEWKGWCTLYSEDGKVLSRFYGLGNGKNAVKQQYNSKEELEAFHVTENITIYWGENRILSEILLREGNTLLGFQTFPNGAIRRTQFSANNYWNLQANFKSNGEVNQIVSNQEMLDTVSILREKAAQIAAQYNPEWAKIKFDITTENGNKDYQLTYKDGTPFLNLHFKDSLLHGNLTVFNPLEKDTLLHAEFERAQPVGNWVKKNMDGVTLYRKSFHDNHVPKEIYTYNNDGLPISIIHQDDAMQRSLYIEYHSNGVMKSYQEPQLKNYIYFTKEGDTTSYNWLFTEEDSIRIHRVYYANHQLKTSQQTNYTSGVSTHLGFYENGQKQYIQTLRTNQKERTYQKFDEEGRILLEGEYKNNKKEGEWKRYTYEEKEESIDTLVEILYYEEGEFQIPKNSETPCRCYDKSMRYDKIGFAPSLSSLLEYKKLIEALPSGIVPMDELNYDKIFYVNLQYSGGFSSMKVLPYKDFSFYYPSEKYLKFNLTPCSVEGYIPNFDANIIYNHQTKRMESATILPDRIAVSLANNPLKVKETKENYVGYFDVESLEFRKHGLVAIHDKRYTTNCFPEASLADWITFDIKKASIALRPPSTLQHFIAPLMSNEIKKLFGLIITESNFTFPYSITATDSLAIQGKTNQLLAGYNFVAGVMEIEGKWINDEEFQPENHKQAISKKKLQSFMEEKGFFRISIDKDTDTMLISFYFEN